MAWMRVVVLGAALLSGASAASSARWLGEDRAHAAAIAALDPSRLAAIACAGRNRGASMLRQSAQLATGSDITAAAVKALPLYPGVPRSAFNPGGITAAARPWFDQGLEMAYNFNHAAAIASFRRAQALAPGCALCFWGEALAYGPNINAPMDDGSRAATDAAMARGRALAARAPALDRALIAALDLRYDHGAGTDRGKLDAAFADAMLALAAKNPGNDDLDVIAAEAAMDTTPWNYWDADRRNPNPRIDRAVALVEGVLARHPQHQEAAHLYIHLTENYVDPKRGEAAADALHRSALPVAGHLVHMPGHIFYRVGRFKDSITANIAAARADEAYLAKVPDDGIYRYDYYPHNVHFIVASAQQAGDFATAIDQADKLARIIPAERAATIGTAQIVLSARAFAYAQAGTPEQILAQPLPDARLPYLTAIWHYARATAQARLHQRDAALAEIAAMDPIAASPQIAALNVQGMPVRDLIHLAQHVARGRLAYAEGHFDAAAAQYRVAQAIEATIPYTEPPFWYYPVGQSLGAALMAAGKPAEARAAFQQALIVAPGNSWALYGLAQAERALGHSLEARAAEAALDRAWLGNSALLTLDRL